MFLIVIVAILVGTGIFLIRSGKAKLEVLKEYEFNNRGPGGMVSFASYEDSKKHNKARDSAKRTSGFGGTLITVAVAILVILFMVRS